MMQMLEICLQRNKGKQSKNKLTIYTTCHQSSLKISGSDVNTDGFYCFLWRNQDNGPQIDYADTSFVLLDVTCSPDTGQLVHTKEICAISVRFGNSHQTPLPIVLFFFFFFWPCDGLVVSCVQKNPGCCGPGSFRPGRWGGNKTFRPQDVSPLVVSPLGVSPLFSTLVVSPPYPSRFAPITISPLVVSLPNIFHYLFFIQFLIKLAFFFFCNTCDFQHSIDR